MSAIINNWVCVDTDFCQYVKCSFKSEEGGKYNHYKLIQMDLINPDTQEYEVYFDTKELIEKSIIAIDAKLNETVNTINNLSIYTTIYKINVLQGPTIYHRELYSIYYNNL